MKKYIFILSALFVLGSCASTGKTTKKKKTTTVKLSGPQVTSSARELVRITDDVVAEFQPNPIS